MSQCAIENVVKGGSCYCFFPKIKLISAISCERHLSRELSSACTYIKQKCLTGPNSLHFQILSLLEQAN